MEITDWATIIQTALTAILAMLTFFYVRTTGRQLTAMREALEETRRSNAATEKSNEIAERSLELGMRSWLIIKRVAEWPVVPTPDYPGGASTLSSSVVLENVGKVPAFVRRYGWGFVVGDLPERFELSASAASTAIIYGERGPAGFLRSFDAAELDAIGNRAERPLYLYWLVEYSDCLEKEWRTVKCWRWGHLMAKWEEATEPQCNRLE